MIKPLPSSVRESLSEMSPDVPVRVYTYQSHDSWNAALVNGHLSGEGAPVDKDWKDIAAGPYQWMRRQMASRITDFSGDLPVWCWLKRRNPRQADWTAGTVRITAMVPRGRMLISDYELWHMPLNHGPIVDNEDEYDKWDWKNPDGKEAIEATWSEIFRITDRTERDPKWIGRPDLLQACVDRIRLDEIVDVRHMPARGRKMITKTS